MENELYANYDDGSKSKLKDLDVCSLLDLGADLIEQDKESEAILAFEAALDKDPDYVPAMENLSSAYFSVKKYEDSLYWAERALAFNDELLIASFYKVVASAKLNKPLGSFIPYYRYVKSLCHFKDNLLLKEVRIQYSLK